MRTTYMAKPGDVKRKWYVVDAQGQTLGRLASEVAAILRGKTKPQYTPHIDVGDNVIIVNAEKNPLDREKAFSKVLSPSQRLSGWTEIYTRRRHAP